MNPEAVFFVVAWRTKNLAGPKILATKTTRKQASRISPCVFYIQYYYLFERRVLLILFVVVGQRVPINNSIL